MAEICYTQLNLLLLAIEARKYEGGEIYINPKDKVINPNVIGEALGNFNTVHIFCAFSTFEHVLAGLFMTDSADSAKRAWFYCRKCHANIKHELQVDISRNPRNFFF